MNENNINNCENCSVDIEVGGDLVIVADDYLKLKNKPAINGVELAGNLTTEELGIEVSNPIELINELNTETTHKDNQAYTANTINEVVKSFEEATNGIYEEIGNTNGSIEEVSRKTSGLETSVADLESKDAELENLITNFEETDPTIPDFVKNITEEDIAKWNESAEVLNIDTTNQNSANTYTLKWGEIKNGTIVNIFGEKDTGYFRTENIDTYFTIPKGTYLYFNKTAFGVPVAYDNASYLFGITGDAFGSFRLHEQASTNKVQVSDYRISASSVLVSNKTATISGVWTFSNPPKIEKTPTYDNQATNKLYVDTAISTAVTDALGTIETELEEI